MAFSSPARYWSSSPRAGVASSDAGRQRNSENDVARELSSSVADVAESEVSRHKQTRTPRGLNLTPRQVRSFSDATVETLVAEQASTPPRSRAGTGAVSFNA